jgi:hypothetical protein
MSLLLVQDILLLSFFFLLGVTSVVAKNAAMGAKSNVASFYAFANSFAIGFHKSAAGVP